MHRDGSWKDALEAQHTLWAWWRSDAGARYADGWGASVAEKNPDGRRMSGSEILGIEQWKLAVADPIFVSGEFADIVNAAWRDFQAEPLLASDLLTGHGFLYLAKPILMPDALGHIVTVRAIGWCPVANKPEPGAEPVASGINLSYYSHSDDAHLESETEAAEVIEAMRAAGMPPPAGLSLLHTTSIWDFDTSPDDYLMKRLPDEIDDRYDLDLVLESEAAWWKVTQTIFRLMMQQIAVRTREQPDRPLRRRLARAGFDERYITVVRLRRPKGPKHDGESDPVEWAHRWVVGGHWRNQWYPSLNVHRQVWISPYVKGPEDKPLVIRTGRVFELVR